MSFLKFAILTIFTFATSISIASHTCTDDEFVKLNSKGLPAGSSAIMKRIIECNHWGGEGGDTSPEKTKQIEEGVKKAKCDSLPNDQAAFINLHKKIKKLKPPFLKLTHGMAIAIKNIYLNSLL